MKAVRLDDYNTAPVIRDIATPEIGPEDVLVRVGAAALNPLDIKLQSGVLQGYFPLEFRYTVGADLAGMIEDVGANVIGWQKGDKVIARLYPVTGGAFAGFACVPASYLVKVPEDMSLEVAAGIPTAAGTAWQTLFELGDLGVGQTVLIHAGAGGVGSFAIQFARAAGARVIATASGDGIDTIGGETQQKSFGVLRSGGRLLSLVAPPDEALANAHNVNAQFVFHMSDGDRLARVVSAMTENNVRVLIDRTVPLDQFADAFARQSSGRARGKIIATMV